MDIDLIKQCADDRLAPAVIELFVDAVEAEPLSVKVTTNGKAVLLLTTPKVVTSRHDKKERRSIQIMRGHGSTSSILMTNGDYQSQMVEKNETCLE